MTLVDISDLLTPKAFQELKKGQILRFTKAEFRIVRINKKSNKCWAESIHTYDPNEIAVRVVDAD